MLKNDVMEDPDWDRAFQTARDATPKAFQTYLVEPRSAVVNLNYPVKLFPTKIKSLSFDKTELIEGTLLGIKGQYLLFDDNRVLNIRKHNGYTLDSRHKDLERWDNPIQYESRSPFKSVNTRGIIRPTSEPSPGLGW